MTLVLAWALRLAVGFLVVAIACALVRLLRGPTAEDRVLALDTLYLDALLVMLTLGLSYRSATYVEAALLMSLVGFASSTALAKYLLRGEIIE